MALSSEQLLLRYAANTMLYMLRKQQKTQQWLAYDVGETSIVEYDATLFKVLGAGTTSRLHITETIFYQIQIDKPPSPILVKDLILYSIRVILREDAYKTAIERLNEPERALFYGLLDSQLAPYTVSRDMTKSSLLMDAEFEVINHVLQWCHVEINYAHSKIHQPIKIRFGERED